MRLEFAGATPTTTRPAARNRGANGVGLTLALVAVVVAVRSPDIPPPVVWVPVAAAVFALWRAIDPQEFPRPRAVPDARWYHWVITDEGVTRTTENSVASWRWAAFAGLRVTTAAYVLRMASGQAVEIPRAPLSPEQDAALGALLTEWRRRP